MCKEAFDDFKRFSRDKELNNIKYEVLHQQGDFAPIAAQDLKVGQIIRIV